MVSVLHLIEQSIGGITVNLDVKNVELLSVITALIKIVESIVFSSVCVLLKLVCKFKLFWDPVQVVTTNLTIGPSLLEQINVTSSPVHSVLLLFTRNSSAWLAVFNIRSHRTN